MFRVGQMVVCVNNSDAEFALDRGRIYEVERVGPGCSGRLRLDLIGVMKAGTGNPAWNADRFRPVKDTSIEIFRRLVANPKDKVRA